MIEAVLNSHGASFESIRLLRDKTGHSRRFAFVKFTTLEHAKHFVGNHFPVIEIDDNGVRIDFSLTTPNDDEDWTCAHVLHFSHSFETFIVLDEMIKIRR